MNVNGKILTCKNLISYEAFLQFERVVADAGYESEENPVYLRDYGIEAYIKPPTMNKLKQRYSKKKSAVRKTCSTIKREITIAAITERKPHNFRRENFTQKGLDSHTTLICVMQKEPMTENYHPVHPLFFNA